MAGPRRRLATDPGSETSAKPDGARARLRPMENIPVPTNQQVPFSNVYAMHRPLRGGLPTGIGDLTDGGLSNEVSAGRRVVLASDRFRAPRLGPFLVAVHRLEVRTANVAHEH